MLPAGYTPCSPWIFQNRTLRSPTAKWRRGNGKSYFAPAGARNPLEIDPRSTDARVGIARVLVGRVANATSSRSYHEASVQQDVTRVERLLSEAIESDPNQPMAYAVLGLLRRTQARLSESRIALEKALTLDPNFEWANMQLGWTLMFLGECGGRHRPGRKKPAAEPTRSEYTLSF